MEKTFKDSFELQELVQVFNRVNDHIASEVRDTLELTHNARFDFPDESKILITSYTVSYPRWPRKIDLKAIAIRISSSLPEEIRESFIRLEHITLKNEGLESLQIHWNDSTFQLIYHCTGQF